MNEIETHNLSDEELLVAYLDGALDAETRAEIERRLEASPELSALLQSMDISALDLEPSFDALLAEAPQEKLRKNLETAHLVASQPQATGAIGWGAGRMAAAAVLMLAMFGAGYLLGVVSPVVPNQTAKIEKPKTGPDTGSVSAPTKLASNAKGWRQAVADYMALYERRTLELVPRDDLTKDRNLSRLSEITGAKYSRENLGVGGLEYKRGQLLEFKSMPLLQFAFLSDEKKPVALCIVKNMEADKPLAFERRSGLNIVHWARGGRAFMLIGDLGEDEIRRLGQIYLDRLG